MSYRSLFSSSYLGLIHILLDQTRYDEMRILGCEALYDFVTNQVHTSCQFYISFYNIRFFGASKSDNVCYCFFQTEGTYMFNLDGLIPKICPLAHELGEEERTTNLCAAGLQALSSLVVISTIEYDMSYD